MGIISLLGDLVKLVSFCSSAPVLGGEGGRHCLYRVGAGNHGWRRGGVVARVNGYVELWGELGCWDGF